MSLSQWLWRQCPAKKKELTEETETLAPEHNASDTPPQARDAETCFRASAKGDVNEKPTNEEASDDKARAPFNPISNAL